MGSKNVVVLDRHQAKMSRAIRFQIFTEASVEQAEHFGLMSGRKLLSQIASDMRMSTS